MAAKGEHLAANKNGNALRLHDALHSVGSSLFGIVGVDLWVFNDEEQHFEHADFWISQYFEAHSAEQADAMAQIRSGKLNKAQAIGEGLSGYFWSNNPNHSKTKQLTWTHLSQITGDPDQVPCELTNQTERAGFEKAVGVPYDACGHKGLVIYFARATADESQLNWSENVLHMQCAAQMLGALVASFQTSAESHFRKAAHTTAICRRARVRLSVMRRLSQAGEDKTDVGNGNASDQSGTNRPTDGAGESKKSLSQALSMLLRGSKRRFVQAKDFAVRKAKSTATKSKGNTKANPPPPTNWKESGYTFLGVFVTMICLMLLSRYFQRVSGQGIVLGPFGAFMALQFGLTPAPASQPRNGILGQTMAMLVSILLKMATSSVMDPWWVPPLATALAIGLNAKAGVIHPPAGASAFLFAANPALSFLSMGLVLAGYVLSIALATLLNNLNDKRQYPMYWKFFPQLQMFARITAFASRNTSASSGTSNDDTSTKDAAAKIDSTERNTVSLNTRASPLPKEECRVDDVTESSVIAL
eukprot:TRINITY_DN23045_c0_g2_i1.p1 TRINITY_DN23045_c0_g2~~TRINITY_DN23045_c0_g2_i1.p1  ORF type:complete len:530 (+),score=73.08 TRINITY_DN23045_c0_g2_i1:43-1632(+)